MKILKLENPIQCIGHCGLDFIGLSSFEMVVTLSKIIFNSEEHIVNFNSLIESWASCDSNVAQFMSNNDLVTHYCYVKNNKFLFGSVTTNPKSNQDVILIQTKNLTIGVIKNIDKIINRVVAVSPRHVTKIYEKYKDGDIVIYDKNKNTHQIYTLSNNPIVDISINPDYNVLAATDRNNVFFLDLE